MADLRQIERQWKLLWTLSKSRYGLTVEELAHEFDVNVKTIRRDLQTLDAVRFPLEERRGAHGLKRWHVRDLSDVPEFAFTLNEILSLYLARRFLEPLAGTRIWDGVQEVFSKVRTRLGERALRYFAQLDQEIFDPQQRRSDYSEFPDRIDDLVVAIQDRLITSIGYQSLRATEPVTYEVHPYGMVHHKGSLYLVADSQTHGEFRTFKVDRISEVGTLELRFVRKEFDLKNRYEHSFGIWSEDGEPVKVVIQFAQPVARYVEEHHWPGCEKKSPTPDGGIRCEFRLAGTQEITAWILSFGANAVVLEPPELVESIRAEAGRLARLYADGDGAVRKRRAKGSVS